MKEIIMDLIETINLGLKKYRDNTIFKRQIIKKMEKIEDKDMVCERLICSPRIYRRILNLNGHVWGDKKFGRFFGMDIQVDRNLEIPFKVIGYD